ncbi:hypothetical protein CDV36_010249 [Fusarium kuroshium]|uniref:Uncharacterized protein n=1 Tax=Fusarium kuroshium TaxID=2010991 RepID=A0A3M2RXY9_9HYPO|nr:hypothetical protein CDV36_010249 [Fusarium kuroshium]
MLPQKRPSRLQEQGHRNTINLPITQLSQISPTHEHDRSRHHRRDQTHFSERQAIPSDGTTITKTNESQGVNPGDDSSDECRQEDEAHMLCRQYKISLRSPSPDTP